MRYTPDEQQAAATEEDYDPASLPRRRSCRGLSGRYGAHVNALGLNCRKYPPKSSGPVASSSGEPTPIGMIFCQGGGMAIGTGPGKLSIAIGFKAAPQSSKAAIPARGECAWSDRPIAANEPKMMLAPLKGDVKSLVAAAQQGGIFLVHVGMSGTSFWVTSIDSVNVGFVPGAGCPEGQIRLKGQCQVPPLLPGTSTGKGGGFIQMFPTCPAGETFNQSENRCVGADADAGAGGGTAGFAAPKTLGPVEFGKGGATDTGDDAGNDTGGGNANPPMHADDGSCGGPGAVATVVIPEPNLHKLNVRTKPGGNVLGTVPEGEQVTVVGPCGSEAAAGFAKSTKPLGGMAGWCQLDAPVGGCVMAKYLDFSGGGGGDAAGFAPAAGFAKPAVPAPAGGNDEGDNNADAGGGGDVAPPMHADDGSCGGPGATATVVIPEPNLHKLNVRTKPGGNVLGTVPEGEQVTVVGPCGSEAAAGFAKSNKPLGGMAGWCQLDTPVAGCVMAKYLDFSGGGGGDDAGAAPAAGFAKTQPKTEAPAPMGVSFSGRWAANAEDVSYTLSLKQKGNGVSGSFKGSDGSVGTLNGKLQGNVLRFSWSADRRHQGNRPVRALRRRPVLRRQLHTQRQQRPRKLERYPAVTAGTEAAGAGLRFANPPWLVPKSSGCRSWPSRATSNSL